MNAILTDLIPILSVDETNSVRCFLCISRLFIPVFLADLAEKQSTFDPFQICTFEFLKGHNHLLIDIFPVACSTSLIFAENACLHVFSSASENTIEPLRDFRAVN